MDWQQRADTGGVTIGDGAVIGMGAVVTADVPPYSVVAGVPARIIRFRFSPNDIELLMRIKWWDWPEEAIQSSPSSFLSIDLLKEHPLAK